MAVIPNRADWCFGYKEPLITDKKALIETYKARLYNKSAKMFKYNNLPDTLDPKMIEIQTQRRGFVIGAEVRGSLYTFAADANLGGELNAYYIPTKAIIANPWIDFNAELTIGKDCVIIMNDFLWRGLDPTFTKYAELLAEAEISLRMALINARIPSVITADDDSTAKSARDFFTKIVDGSEYGVVLTEELSNGVTALDFTKQSVVKDVIEAIQYIKGSLANEMGLRAAYNMKREAINEAEAALNDNILSPIVDVMLECRQIGWKQFNDMFSTNVTVELDSSWKFNEKEKELSIEIQEKEVEDGDTVGDSDGRGEEADSVS